MISNSFCKIKKNIQIKQLVPKSRDDLTRLISIMVICEPHLWTLNWICTSRVCDPGLRHNRRPVVPGGAGGAMAHLHFGRSVNPISTKGCRLCPPNYTGIPGFSNLPTALNRKVCLTVHHNNMSTLMKGAVQNLDVKLQIALFIIQESSFYLCSK